jgi:hypothetical protein
MGSQRVAFEVTTVAEKRGGGQGLMIYADWLWIKQEDSPHDALRPQGFPRQ